MSEPGPKSPRGRLIWGGFCLSGWLRLLARNRFAIEPQYRGAVRMTTVMSAVSSLLGVAQEIFHGRAIRRTKLREAPIFILGHWRCGTTFLFDLLSRDRRFAYPDTYECFFPGHFLVSRDFVTSRVPLQGDRGVDHVQLGWGQPREDEFALCALGQPSPYLTAAFPNQPPQDPEYLDLRGLSRNARRSWERAYFGFLQALTYRKQKRLLLKCPPHTRIPVLARLFPDARFVHIVRDPFAVIPSTLRLWRTSFDSLGLQTPTYAGLEDYVFANFRRLYDRLEKDRQLIAPSRYHELRYEELVADPLRESQAIYDRLALGEFESLRPSLQEYLKGLHNYQPNQHTLSPDLRAAIRQNCAAMMQRYGYTDSVSCRPHARRNSVAPHLEREEVEALPITAYVELRPHLHTGDLLFASGQYPISRMIQQVTHSLWSHVGIVLRLPVLERVLLLESVEGIGVRIVPVSKYLEDYLDDRPFNGLVVIARVAGVTTEMAKTLMQFGADELGRPYNDAEVAALHDPDALLLGNLSFRARTYVCSELVRACFHNAGFDFQASHGGLISPEDIWADERVTLLARIQ